MIIRMTVYDNDFTLHLENFVENLRNRLMFSNESKIKDAPDVATQMAHHLHKSKIYDIMYLKSKLDPANVDIIKNEVLNEWSDYVDHNINTTGMIPNYLIDNFEVTISDTYVDNWENGEVVYYFTNPNLYITQ